MMRRDLPSVLEIENACYKVPWTKDSFVKAMTTMGMLGFVITDDVNVVKGFMVYRIVKDKKGNGLYLVNLAIGPLDQRRGLGKVLLNNLKDKAAIAKCQRIETIVHEGNLPAQLWLKANGFLGYRVEKDHFEDGSDGYCFKYEIKK